MHPNWVFLRVFGDTAERIEAEERRLFYVALTRSRHSLVILSDDQRRESPYLRDIKARMNIESIRWSQLAPVPSLDGARLEVRVSHAYHVRDEMKDLHYRWNEQGKYWSRSVMAEDFDFNELCQQAWARDRVHIEVYAEDGGLLHQK